MRISTRGVTNFGCVGHFAIPSSKIFEDATTARFLLIAWLWAAYIRLFSCFVLNKSLTARIWQKGSIGGIPVRDSGVLIGGDKQF